MPRGGLRKTKDGKTNHLFTPKWNNKNTTAIRVPAIFKDALLGIARHLDKSRFSSERDTEVIDDIVNCFLYKEQANSCQSELENLKKKYQDLSDETRNKTNQNSQKNKKDNYKIAAECFEKFLNSQSLNLEELSKSRKGTKKHQLYEINQWLIKKSNDNVVINDYY